MHREMLGSDADALIFDLEDFTPPHRRPAARALLHDLLAGIDLDHRRVAIRINALDAEGTEDLVAAMNAGARIISLPMAETRAQIAELDAAIRDHENRLGVAPGTTELLPVCETALGVVDVRAIASASERICAAVLGAEDLAADLGAGRTTSGMELAHARARFLFDCRAAHIEPIDAPFTFGDVDGAVREARASRAMGYRSKALVRPDHTIAVNDALTPSASEIDTARRRIAAFDAARERGEDRVLVDDQWVEVPTCRAARRLLELARAYGMES